MTYQYLVGGEAGFGIMTTGLVLSKIAARTGYHIFDYVQYPSLIRGGHNAYTIRLSDVPVYSLHTELDMLVCLNNQTYELHKAELKRDGVVIYDPQDNIEEPQGATIIKLPFREILKKEQGSSQMKNTIVVGAVLAVLGGEVEEMHKILEEQFGKKGDRVVELNQKFVKLGYDYIKEHYAKVCMSVLTKKDAVDEQLVLTGNDAFALGAVASDCKFYAAYPMTPSSSVLATLAAWQEKAGMVVRHSEDEIAVINTALGASFAGVRAAVGTSGGGFALMVEGVSLAGVTETPVVIFLSQRPGPATGMPTWTEDGDLLFAVHAGHGEFPKIVLAPANVEEMVTYTTKAFDLADIYQTPVIILSDMFLSESHKSLPASVVRNLFNTYKVNRGKILHDMPVIPYFRYAKTSDGISPRLVPGMKNVTYQANSYEHDETGHTTEDGQERVVQVMKRNKKIETYLKNHFEEPKLIGDINTARTVFVTWGSMKGPVLEAQQILTKRGIHTALIHFHHVYPLDQKRIEPFFAHQKKYVVVENNSQAQFAQLLRQETGITIHEKLLRFDGRPITPQQIIHYVANN